MGVRQHVLSSEVIGSMLESARSMAAKCSTLHPDVDTHPSVESEGEKWANVCADPKGPGALAHDSGSNAMNDTGCRLSPTNHANAVHCITVCAGHLSLAVKHIICTAAAPSQEAPPPLPRTDAVRGLCRHRSCRSRGAGGIALIPHVCEGTKKSEPHS